MAIIGVDVPVLLAWEAVLLVATEFHHSNLRLPLRFERALRTLLVTPRMHGIHHSIVPGEVNPARVAAGDFLKLKTVQLWGAGHLLALKLVIGP